MFYVYIITHHTNTVFYIGITNNLEKRIAEHICGININSFSSSKEVIMIEKRLKGWKRDRKIKLIKEKKPEFKNLLKAEYYNYSLC